MEKTRHASPITLVLISLVVWLLASVPGIAQDQPKDELAELREAEFALSVGKIDRAIELLTSAISKKPDEVAAYLGRALAYSKKGEYDKSIEDLKKVTQMKNPEAAFEAYNMLGRLYEIKKDYASAQKAYQEAMSRAKDPATKRLLQGWVEDMDARLKKPK